MSRMVKSGGAAIVVVDEEEIVTMKYHMKYVFTTDNNPTSSLNRSPHDSRSRFSLEPVKGIVQCPIGLLVYVEKTRVFE